MIEKLSPHMEDYLKAIYRIYRTRPTQSVRVSDLALAMNLTKASASNATKVLQSKGMLKKDKSRGLFLTEQGLEYADFIIERQAVLVRFLTEVLRLDWPTAHVDACGMEHVISTECYLSMRVLLNQA